MLKENITDILFLDIETVPEYSSYDLMPEKLKELWDKKTAYARKDGETPEETYGRAGIWAEFGRIVCICCGYITIKNGNKVLRIKSFDNAQEKQMLEEFSILVQNFFKVKPFALLCAHNGKEFDMPYIARRMIINGIDLPKPFNVFGKKPWEVPFIDTMELWKFGDHKHYTSLSLLTEILNIPTPKDDIDGSMVADVYHNEKNIDRITTYCKKDVLAVAQLIMRYINEPLIDEVIEVD